MITDASVEKMDLTLTKSVLRFSRNTVATLSYVRQLKQKQDLDFFEKDNFYTMDSKGGLLIAIMNSLTKLTSMAKWQSGPKLVLLALPQNNPGG